MPRRLALVLAILLPVAWPPGPAPLGAQTPSTVVGRVTDAASAEAVAGAVVRLSGLPGEEVTDAEGRFVFRSVPAGAYLLTVQHLGYGLRSDSITVQARESLSVTVRISPAAIELEPMVVEVWSREQLERRARGTRLNLVTREDLRRFEGRAVSIGDVLSALVPNVSVRQPGARPGAGLCIEFRRPASLQDPLGCKMPMVVVDNVRVVAPAHYLEALNISDIESIEIVPAAEAGVLYGTGSRYGVLRIETREPGPDRDEEGQPRILEPRRAYNWSVEPRRHRWQRVFLASAAGNLAGLALGLLGRDCTRLYGPGRTDCSTAGSIAAAAGALGLSLAGATFGATRFGATERSVGKPLYTALLAAAVALPAYAVVDAARRVPNGGGEWLGGAMFLVGVPAAATLGDHLFRRLKNPKALLPVP